MQRKLHSIILAVILTVSFCLGIGVNVNAAPFNQTVEGEGNHFVTGKAYPSKIEVAGYDVVNHMYYVNFELIPDSGTMTSIAYYVQIFNDAKTLISINGGSYGSSTSITFVEAATTTDTINGVYSLGTTELTKNYSLIITVESVTQ